MSDHAQSFIAYLIGLKDSDRGALAHLKRSLGFDPGAYPRAYPYVERFVGADQHAEAPWRKAMYLAAGLFAGHLPGEPEHAVLAVHPAGGHHVPLRAADLDEACRWVLRCCRGYRLPEPTRLAHQAASGR